MEVRLLTRPAAQCCLSSASTAPRSSFLIPQSLQITSRRHKSTSGRARRSLTIQPHPSFLAGPGPSDKAPGGGGHIVFNPPSSAPSVHHTPFKFLPKNDPRRRANLPSLFESSTTISYGTAATASPSSSSKAPGAAEHLGLPRLLHPSYKFTEKRHTLSEDDVAEMRRLRVADPAANSVAALARRFDCSHLFVMMCCQAPPEHAARRREDLERVKSRWGAIRSRAREDRQRRRDMLFRGEL